MKNTDLPWEPPWMGFKPALPELALYHVCTVALVAQLVERSPRMRSVVGSNPTQGSFLFEKRKSCPGCISLPCLIVMYNILYMCIIYMYIRGCRSLDVLHIDCRVSWLGCPQCSPQYWTCTYTCSCMCFFPSKMKTCIHTCTCM